MKVSSWILAVLTAILAMLVCRPAAAFDFSDFDRFRRACPSTNVNVWKVKIGSDCYLVTPAHVGVYSKDGIWEKSKFLDDFKGEDWQIRPQYFREPSPQDDICWTKFQGDDSDALHLEESDIVDPMKACVIFRQPYDMNAVWVSPGPEMGATEVILYKSPKPSLIVGSDDIPMSDDRPMLESMDVGFRGMSGAIAVNDNGKCIGMFVKRGTLIPLKPPRKVSAEEEYEDTAKSLDFATVPARPSSWIEKVLYPSRSADMASINAQFRYLNAQFRRIDAQLQNLTDVVLKKEDLSELGVVFDARRGLFLPATNIISIGDTRSISIDDIIGSRAPEIPRF